MNTQPIDPRAWKAAEEIFNQSGTNPVDALDMEDIAAIIQSHFAESVNGKLLEACVAADDALQFICELGGLPAHEPECPEDDTCDCEDVARINDAARKISSAIVEANHQPPSMADELAESPTWPYVLAFAKRMEAKLAKNRHKGDRAGWLKDHPWALVERMLDETVEVQQSFIGTNDNIWTQDPEKTANECADVANFCMMVADCVTAKKGQS